MSHPTTVNGRPQRKQLSDQLDRLDSIIDALADGLPAAVAEAAREGTRAAVKDAIVEILTNPELRSLVQSFTPPEPSSVPIPVSPEPAPVPNAWQRLKARLTAARTTIAIRYQAVKETATSAVRMLSSIMPLRRIVLVASGVGIVVAALGYVAPAGIAAVLAGIGGCVTAAVAQVGSWFRRSIRSVLPC